MRSGRGTADNDKPGNLFNQGTHEGLNESSLDNDGRCWKHIVVCGDDFGMNSSVDAGMFQLAQLGRLSAISCLTQGPTFSANARLLRDANVEVGLHLNLTEAFGHRDQLAVMPLSALVTRAYAGYLNDEQIDAQLARQFDAFERVLGRAPDYVDGHQHVHQLPRVLPRLLLLLRKRYGSYRPWLRYTAPGMQAGIPMQESAKAHVIAALGASAVARAAQRDGWRTNRRLLGVYGLNGGARHYAGLLHQWLSNARDGDLLMCHPAVAGAGDKLAGQRAAEFEVLARPELGQWMRQNGVHIDRPSWH
ncbi:ChbG/HpnK family deacetylase [Bordetella tumbae]